MGNGLTDDGVQSNEDGEGEHCPETAAHGVDALFRVKLLHLLVHFYLVVGIALLDILHLTAETVHPQHTLLGFHLEGQHDELDDQSEQDQCHAVGTRQIIEQTDQPGKRYANVVANGGHSCFSSDILLNQGTGS